MSARLLPVHEAHALEGTHLAGDQRPFRRERRLLGKLTGAAATIERLKALNEANIKGFQSFGVVRDIPIEEAKKRFELHIAALSCALP